MPVINLSEIKGRTRKGYQGIKLCPRSSGSRIAIRFGTDASPIFAKAERIEVLYDTDSRVMALRASDKGFKLSKKKHANDIEVNIRRFDFLSKISKPTIVKLKASGAGWVEFFYPKEA